MKYIKLSAVLAALVIVLSSASFSQRAATWQEFGIEDFIWMSSDDPSEIDPDWRIYSVVNLFYAEGSCVAGEWYDYCKISMWVDGIDVIQLTSPDGQTGRVTYKVNEESAAMYLEGYDFKYVLEY